MGFCMSIKLYNKHAECHPDRVCFVANLCRSCYQKSRRILDLVRIRKRDRERQKEYRKTRLDIARKQGRESYQRHKQKRIIYQKVRNYGITSEQYLEMLNKRNGVCDICKNVVKQLVVDHNHKNGEIRGMLCYKCNQALGLFGENAQTMKQAIEYVYKKL